MEKLNIQKEDGIKTSTKRRNLIFKVNSTYQRQKFVIEYAKAHKDQAGIIYCSTRKQVEELQESLESINIASAIYHAGLTNKEREEAQNDFVYDQQMHLEWVLINLMFVMLFITTCLEILNHTIKKRVVQDEMA